MRLIKPLAEILKPSPEADLTGQTLKMIEIAGRTCYKSEDKITDDSARTFVDMLIAKGHTAMLEHGTVYLRIPICDYTKETCGRLVHNPYSFWTRSYRDENSDLYVSTNYRVLLENNLFHELKYQIAEDGFIFSTFSNLFRRVTVRFTCDRGISHEFVRHRIFSFAQESTRFCNYGKDKFGNELTFILPCWMDSSLAGNYGTGYKAREKIGRAKTTIENWHFLDSLIDAEYVYKRLLNLGWTPQQARAVLPNAVKTELVMTGTVSQWLGFFTLRCASNAHPQARELALDLRQQFIDNNYIADSNENQTD
jgi:thymidylate synthase (FAD)